MKKSVIILIGPICAGKGQVSQILQEQYSFSYFRFSASLEAIMFEKFGEIKREYYAIVANELRAKYGPASLAKVTVDQAQASDSQNIVIDGARNPAEIEYIKDFYQDHKCIAIAIDAPQELRFQRLKSRQRVGDPQTFDEFKAYDDNELYGHFGDTGIRINDCIALADITIQNTGTFQELQQKLDEILRKHNLV